jgi:hypothetical protein
MKLDQLQPKQFSILYYSNFCEHSKTLLQHVSRNQISKEEQARLVEEMHFLDTLISQTGDQKM